MGISSENLGRIFELFQRVEGDGDIPGTGLGLAICKKIVESHGGQIWATSKLHVGTTFLFTLPIVQGEP
jgi:signal transduction histidine kinase